MYSHCRSNGSDLIFTMQWDLMISAQIGWFKLNMFSVAILPYLHQGTEKKGYKEIKNKQVVKTKRI